MAKTRQQKETTLSELTDLLGKAKSVVFADFRGLSVKDASDFRRKCRKEGVGCLVAKKTLMRLAFAKAGYADVDPVKLQGSLLLALGYEDEVAPAKLAAEFSKDRETFKVVAGVLERKLVDAAAIAALAKLPSKKELIASVVGSIRAPLSGLVNVLQGNIRGLVNALNAVKDQKAAVGA